MTLVYEINQNNCIKVDLQVSFLDEVILSRMIR